jgi:hypothetical protein
MSSKSFLLNTAAPIADLAALEGEWRIVAEARDRLPLPWLCLFGDAALQACTASCLQPAQVGGQPRHLLSKLALRNAAVAVKQAKENLRQARPLFERLARDPQVGARRWTEALEALDDLPLDWLVIDPGAVLQRPGLADAPALFAAALASGPGSLEAKRRLAGLDADASDDDNFPGMDAGILEPGRFPRRTRTPADTAKLRAQLARLDTCQLAQTPTGFEELPLDLAALEPPPAFWTDVAALARGRARATVSYGASTFMGRCRYYAAHLANVSSRRIRVERFASFVKAEDGGYRIAGRTGQWSNAKDFVERYGVPEDGWIPAGASVTDPVHLGDDAEGFHAYWCEDEAQQRFIALAPRPPSRTGGRIRTVDGRAAPAPADPWTPCPPSVRRVLEWQVGIAKRYAREKDKRTVECDLEGVRWLDDAVETHHRLGAKGRDAGNAALLGAFLGECLVRVFGGRWERLEETLCVRLGDATWFPFNKVEKQLANGRAQGDSVLGFFQGIGALQRKPASEQQQRLVALFKARRDYVFFIAQGAGEFARVRRIDGPWVYLDSAMTAGLRNAPELAIPLDGVTAFKVQDADGRPVDPAFAVVAPTQVLAQPAQPAMEAVLVQQRAAWLPRRERLHGPALEALLGARAPWMRGTEGLGEAFEKQRLLLTQGSLVWGALVQANMALFGPGANDHPAQMLVSRDPWFDARPAELRAIARRLYALKNTVPADPVEKALAARVSNESDHTLAWQLPPEITARPVTTAVVMVYRKHLPGGVLSGACFPLLMHPSTPAVMMLPAAFWTPELAALKDKVS